MPWSKTTYLDNWLHSIRRKPIRVSFLLYPSRLSLPSIHLWAETNFIAPKPPYCRPKVQSKDLNTITNTPLLFIWGGKRCLVTARGFSLIYPFLWAVYFFCCDFLNMQCSWQRLSPLRIDRLLYYLDLLRIPTCADSQAKPGVKAETKIYIQKK